MTWIHNHVFLPLADPQRHWGLAARLRRFELHDKLPPEQQLAIQSDSLRRLLDHASSTTPYYRQLFHRSGFSAWDWHSGQSLPLPVLTDRDIRYSGDELRSRRYAVQQLRPVEPDADGPAPQIWQNAESLRRKTALSRHLGRRAGFDSGDPVLMVDAARPTALTGTDAVRRAFGRTLMRSSTLSVPSSGSASLEKLRLQLNRRRPAVLCAQASIIAGLAEYVKQASLETHKPATMVLSGEDVSPSDRRMIREVFQCTVLRQYAIRSIGVAAADCAAGLNLHFHPQSCVVEFLLGGQTPEGPLYRLIVTDLMNYGMPLIRYDTGYCVLLEESACPCGHMDRGIRAIVPNAAAVLQP